MSPFTEDQIRAIVRIALEETGLATSPERIREVVQQAVDQLEREGPRQFPAELTGRILVICVSPDGPKTSGVLTQALRDSGWAIRERSERAVGGFHTLMAVLERAGNAEDFEILRRKLGEAGNQMGVRIILQTEEALKRQILP